GMSEATMRSDKVAQVPIYDVSNVWEYAGWAYASPIHPRSKKEVGIRMAHAAKYLAYGDPNNGYLAPVYESMEVQSDRIILTFKNVGEGLKNLNELETNMFTIAGSDRLFY